MTNATKLKPNGYHEPIPNGSSRGAVTDTKTDDAHLAEKNARELIPVQYLEPCRFQPRRVFDAAKLKELAASMSAAGGNHTDLIVRLKPATFSKTLGRELKNISTCYEILAGERRWRAAAIAKLPALWCVVLTLDDRDARKLCREENLNREDLTELERITAYRDALNDGDYATQAELATALGITPATLSNQLRVLDLPREFLDLISQEKLTLTHLRSLATWSDKPQVLDWLKQNVFAVESDVSDWDYEVGFGDQHVRTPTVKEFDFVVLEAITDVSRPLVVPAGGYLRERHTLANGTIVIEEKDLPMPSALKHYHQSLDVIDCGKKLGQRAFNVDLWHSLSEAAKTQRAAKKTVSQGDDSPTTARKNQPKKLSAAEQREKTQQLDRHFQRELYTLKIQWLQAEIVQRLQQADIITLTWHLVAWSAIGKREGASAAIGDASIAAGGRQRAGSANANGTDVWKTLGTVMSISVSTPRERVADEIPTPQVLLLRELLRRWYSADLTKWSRPVDEQFIESAAAHLDVGFLKSWVLTREFLEIHTKEQLLAQMREWKLPAVSIDATSTKLALINLTLNYFADAEDKLSRICPLPKSLMKLKTCSMIS